ncbi:MAG: hypothetical protein ACJA2F_000969 [Nitriliruptoraceae bacterium]|jgi:hypothetical protein
MTTDEATTGHEEVRRGGQRVIVVNSQPVSSNTERPPGRLRSLGSVSAHATDPVSVDSRPRRRSTGNSIIGVLSTSLPMGFGALAVSAMTGRSDILLYSTILAAFLLIGLLLAWRGLGPRGRDGRGGVWFGRAIGLVLGGLAAVYLLLEKVSAIL